ncbi:MAG: FKBP-type peptidyl-prolyl cis-trans isomerase [Alistipes sp.]|nr:FKBP-type peptidyl-prolyl cis-trans isomerase [Alistipes sp.]
MKRLYNIAVVAVVAFAATFALSCSNENDTVLTTQQTNISRYLTSSHQPRLIPESQVSASLDSEPEFYTHWGLNIYRYIATYYAEGREEQPEVTSRSQIEIVYTAYVFPNSKPTVANMYATNDPDSIAELEKLKLNTEYEWTTDPMVVTMGREEILPGLETALLGCRMGDSVEIYLTYDEAYGKHYLGLVPAKSAVVWYIDIVNVK